MSAVIYDLDYFYERDSNERRELEQKIRDIFWGGGYI